MTEYKKMTYEDLLTIKTFMLNHKDEIGWMYRLGIDAALQMEYYFLDGQPAADFDPGFYQKVMIEICWRFVEPNDAGWYDHPEDFPDYYERMLFN